MQKQTFVEITIASFWATPNYNWRLGKKICVIRKLHARAGSRPNYIAHSFYCLYCMQSEYAM